MEQPVLKVFDEGRESYIIGDLLNMPYFHSNWPNTPHFDDNVLGLFKKTASQFRDNILGIYDTLRVEPNEPLPNVEKILQACDLYLERNNDKYNELWSDENTLFIHLRSGDKGYVENSFIEHIYNLSTKYKKIVVMCGIHHNSTRSHHFSSVDESKNILLESLHLIQSKCEIIIDTSEPDIHLCTMRNCKNLLVHRGGFSMLGSLLFNGDNLYITNSFYFPKENKKEEFFSYLKNYQII